MRMLSESNTARQHHCSCNTPTRVGVLIYTLPSDVKLRVCMHLLQSQTKHSKGTRTHLCISRTRLLKTPVLTSFPPPLVVSGSPSSTRLPSTLLWEEISPTARLNFSTDASFKNTFLLISAYKKNMQQPWKWFLMIIESYLYLLPLTSPSSDLD